MRIDECVRNQYEYGDLMMHLIKNPDNLVVTHTAHIQRTELTSELEYFESVNLICCSVIEKNIPSDSNNTIIAIIVIVCMEFRNDSNSQPASLFVLEPFFSLISVSAMRCVSDCDCKTQWLSFVTAKTTTTPTSTATA